MRGGEILLSQNERGRGGEFASQREGVRGRICFAKRGCVSRRNTPEE